MGDFAHEDAQISLVFKGRTVDDWIGVETALLGDDVDGSPRFCEADISHVQLWILFVNLDVERWIRFQS